MPPSNQNDAQESSHRSPRSMEIRRGYKPKSPLTKEPSADQISLGSGSNGRKTPSSVYVGGASPLTRDLSDLSGSYVNEFSNRRGPKGQVPGHIYDPAVVKGPWRHAYVLSKLPPDYADDRGSSDSKSGRDATIYPNSKEGVEIVDNLEKKLDMSEFQNSNHNRIPVMILLMDGTRHSYELMQMWMDRKTDSVRDVVQSLQQSVPDKWSHAYDGVFQVRGNRFTQLIHILGLLKYDVQPYEILIAKPWSMTAKVTIAFATSAIRHLTNIGVINTDEGGKSGRRVFKPKSEDAPLLLSNKAQNSIHSPEGIFNHHHAVQFITFSPPLDSNRTPVEITAQHSDNGSSLGSEGAASNIELDRDQGACTKNCVLTALGVSSSPKSVAEAPSLKDEPIDPIAMDKSIDATNLVSQLSPLEMQSRMDNVAGKRRPFAHMFSKLNCCKHKEKAQAAQAQISAFTLTEEQEQAWSAFDVKPTGEEKSVAGHSIVSMSRPLLSRSSS